MKINFNRLVEIYGKEYISIINENIDDISKNLIYLENIGFNDVEDIFERVTPIFINDNVSFVNKINKLIKKLGNDYVNIIESNLSILEELE